MDTIAILGMIMLALFFVVVLLSLGLLAISIAGDYMDVHKDIYEEKEKKKKSEKR